MDLKSAHPVINEIIDLKKQNYHIIYQIQHLQKFNAYFDNPNTYVTKAKCYMGDYTMNVNPSGDVFLWKARRAKILNARKAAISL